MTYASAHPVRKMSVRRRVLFALLALALLLGLFGSAPFTLPAHAAPGQVTIQVFDRHTGSPIADFRFIVNEDVAHRPEDGRPPSQEGPESFSPVVARGDQDSATVTLDPGRYLVSVIGGAGAPAPGEYKMSGTHFTVPSAGGNQNVRVDLIPEPLPTSSIKVVVHHDNHMVNGAQDIPQEQGLAGFSVLLEDGTGEVSVDFYGNPICTEYVNGDPSQGIVPGTGGQCLTDENGEVTIPNLAAHKYGVFAVPPDGSGWIQTSTIEGTHVVDAWVEEGNSGLITEFGVTGPLVALGYVQKCEFGLCPELNGSGKLVFPSTPTVPQGTSTIQGRVVEASEVFGEFNLTPGRPIDRPYIALNNLSGNDEQIYTGRGNPDGTFSIPNVPAGTYQVVAWDEPQLYIISFETAVVATDGETVDMGDILIPSWFGHVQGFAYEDTGKTPTGQTITSPGIVAGTDEAVPGYGNGYRDCQEGSDPFDYANCEPGIPGQDLVIHFNDGSVKYGAVADDHGFYSFDTHFPYGHYMIWEVGFGRGKQMYTTGYFTDIVDGELVPIGYPYSPENKTQDPDGASLLQAEITLAGYYNWIDTGKLPYEDSPDPEVTNGGISGVVRYAVTRNEFDPRLAAAEDYEPGVPGVTINLYTAALDGGSPIGCTEQGPGCPYGHGELMRGDPDGDGPLAAGDLYDTVDADSYYDSRPTGCSYPNLATVPPTTQSDPDCREVPINTQQIQDGVFDGGYAFDSLPEGDYIVEMIAPDHYRHLKEEDQNTDQGDDFVPAPGVEPAYCAGPLHLVNDPRNPVDGEMTPLCDSKLVEVANDTNPAADYFLMVDFDDSVDENGDPVADFTGTTEVPPPGLMRGILFDDLTVQFDTTSVMFGGKKGVPDTPVGFLDYEGNEIAVAYTDDDGFFEVLLPSTYTRLCPTPGGVCAGMYLVVGNYPGQDPLSPDPKWNPNYQTLTVTLDVWPGKTTYADVAILPITGFGFANAPICEPLGPDVQSVSAVNGPVGTSFTIHGAGFGGTTGSVALGGSALTITSWSATSIDVTIPGSVSPGPKQLLVTDSTGSTGETGITFHVTGGAYEPAIITVGPGDSVQDAIDAADLLVGNARNTVPPVVVVEPGTYYESVIVPNRIKLQGHGSGVTSLDGRFFGFGPGTLFDSVGWANKVAGYAPVGPDVPIGQVVTFVAKSDNSYDPSGPSGDRPLKYAQIDGFTIIGGDSAKAGNAALASQGGGVYAHSATHNLQVSNNLVQANAGNAGGGVILGQAYVGDNNNDNVRIHHNRILNNGGTILAGGIGVFDGADGYAIDHNVICGNHSAEYGGGISHYGNSTGSSISQNRIVFNSGFDEGGGVMIAGELPLDPGGLTNGSGTVAITRNLIQHNLSNDDGGGIRLLMPESASTDSDRVSIVNNMIVNNLAADFGGGIALDDAPDTRIINNTIVRNVSTSTAEDADATSCGPTLPLATCPHAAGVTSTPHSAALAGASGSQGTFSDPVMFNNIIWGNTAWYRNGNQGVNPLSQASGVWDLEVVGSTDLMKPKYSVLAAAYGTGAGNQIGAPTFAGSGAIATAFEALPLIGAPNFIGVQINATPGGSQGNYHLANTSVGINQGVASCRSDNGQNGCNGPQANAPTVDFDGQTRPIGSGWDIGADEAQ